MSVVTFLSDYGLRDDFVGVCHGVIARITPRARILDIAHGVARHDNDRLLVGPDNGLLAPLAERLGGAVEAVDVGRSPLRLEPVSASFHGRDIFAAVAAHLATGTSLAQAGEPLDPAALVRLELPRARVTGDGVVAHVLHADRYGNVVLDAEHEDLAAGGLRLGEPVTVGGRRARYARTFADVPAGELLLYEDGYRVLSLAINRGSALAALGLALDDEVLIAPASS